MNVDKDGFLVGNGETTHPVVAPPPVVAIPKFFEDCPTQEHAIAKMIDELTKPISVELEGHDAVYRKLADALILLLSIQGNFVP